MRQITDAETARAPGGYFSDIFIKEGEYKPKNIENATLDLAQSP